MTPLFMAAQEGHVKIVNALLKAGANVDAVRVKDSVTPLLMAVQEGHVEIITLLLKAGANVNAAVSRQGKWNSLRSYVRVTCSPKTDPV